MFFVPKIVIFCIWRQLRPVAQTLQTELMFLTSVCLWLIWLKFITGSTVITDWGNPLFGGLLSCSRGGIGISFRLKTVIQVDFLSWFSVFITTSFLLIPLNGDNQETFWQIHSKLHSKSKAKPLDRPFSLSSRTSTVKANFINAFSCKIIICTFLFCILSFAVSRNALLEEYTLSKKG